MSENGSASICAIYGKKKKQGKGNRGGHSLLLNEKARKIGESTAERDGEASQRGSEVCATDGSNPRSGGEGGVITGGNAA